MMAGRPGSLAASALVPCNKRFINPGAMSDLSAMSAMPFDLVWNEHVHAACNYDVPSLKTTSPVDNPELAGKSSLIKLSSRTGKEHLEHYYREKQKNPESTCAVFVVPRTGRMT